MPIVDHYVPDPEIARLCDEGFKAVKRKDQSSAAKLSAGLYSQKEVIKHKFWGMRSDCQERALRTLSWIDAQTSAYPTIIDAGRYLSVG